MSRDRAAYMREYRAREKRARQNVTGLLERGVPDMVARIAELEEEVRHLKAELARRPMEHGEAMAHTYVEAIVPADRFNTRPFTPVPKGK